jgi:hypothetical protein
MDYFISRDGQQYGPYTLSDLQRYVASGEVLLTDLATSEALTEPVPVAQIVGTIAAPAAYATGGSVVEAQIFPDPPNLHWGLVLLFTVVTCGFFGIVWEIVQAAWMKKIEPQSRSIYYYSAGALALIGIMAVSFMHGLNPSAPNFTGLMQFVYSILVICGRFSFRSSMEDHFNGPEPMALALSGVMTFFFGGIYFQYHINDIIRRKTYDRIYNAGR